jgi:hypothetical protein
MLIKRSKKKTGTKEKINFLKKIFLYFKNFSFILILVQLFILCLIIIFYQSSQLSKTYPPKKILEKINIEKKKATGFDFRSIKDYVAVGLQGLRTKITGNGLELINLSMNQKNILLIESQRLIRNGSKKYNKKTINKMGKAKISILDENYLIKIRTKGVRSLHHFDSKALSYKIDVIGKKRIFGMEEFNLQKPLLRNYSYEYLFHKFQEEVGNISLKYLFKNLSINGSKPSLYVIEEGMSKELIERHGKRNGPILNADELLSEIFPEHAFEAHSEEYWKKENSELLASAYTVINSFREKDFMYEDSFEWKKWARYFAVTDLMQSYHGSLSKSVNFYFNPTTAKFEPIGYDAHVGAGTFNDFLIFDFLSPNSNCSYLCDNKEWYLKFFYSKNKKFREEFIKTYFLTLKKLTNKNFLDNFFKKNQKELNKINNSIYAEFSKVDKINWVGVAPFVFDKNKIYNRARYIKSKIKYFENFNLSKNERHNYKLSLVKNKIYYDSTITNIPIKVKLFCKNNLQVSLWIQGRNFHTVKKCDIIKKNVILYDLNNNSLSVDLTGNYNSQRGYKPTVYKELKKLSEITELKEINNIFYSVEDEIHIKENVYIPKNINIVFGENKIIYFHNNAILFSEANLNFIGTKKNLVKIKGYNKKNGSLIHIGGSFNSQNLVVENLLFPNLASYKLYSGINLINSKNTIKNTSIINSSSEDAINIIDSESYIDELLIKNTLSDALDVDGGRLSFGKIFCENIINDCLDISGVQFSGNLLVVNNAGDKGFSAGENSRGQIKIVKVSNSEIGVAVKDSSIIDINELKLEKVKLDIAVYNKKLEFGESKLKIGKSEKAYNYLVGEDNELEVSGYKITDKLKNKTIINKLYGNQYGSKTIR